jgi:hypothetical protein
MGGGVKYLNGNGIFLRVQGRKQNMTTSIQAKNEGVQGEPNPPLWIEFSKFKEIGSIVKNE